MTGDGNGPLVSLIIPMLNEADNVAALTERVDDIRRRLPGYRFELVAIDDGSTDATARLLDDQLQEQEPWVMLRLSRNFGSHYAVTAGLDHCRGDCAIVLGADLQEPIELIEQFLDEWREGAEVVWGIRRLRATGRNLGTLLSKAFSALFHRFSDLTHYPAEGPSGALVDRRVIDELRSLPERNRNVYGLIAWLGFRQASVEYDQLPRRAGDSKWTRRKLFRLATDSFVQFSSAPLKLATFTGFALGLSGFLYASFLIVRVLLGQQAPEGWTTVVVVTLILGGFQLVMLGLLGEYLWRATDETRRRPVYVVDSVAKSGEPGAGPGQGEQAGSGRSLPSGASDS